MAKGKFFRARLIKNHVMKMYGGVEIASMHC
jgi:hypothetical protein